MDACVNAHAYMCMCTCCAGAHGVATAVARARTSPAPRGRSRRTVLGWIGRSRQASPHGLDRRPRRSRRRRRAVYRPRRRRCGWASSVARSNPKRSGVTRESRQGAQRRGATCAHLEYYTVCVGSTLECVAWSAYLSDRSAHVIGEFTFKPERRVQYLTKLQGAGYHKNHKDITRGCDVQGGYDINLM